MKHFQDLGHRVIFLIGDNTGLIGDPTGRNTTRPPMTREEIDKNAETYKTQVFKILDPDKDRSAVQQRMAGADEVRRHHPACARNTPWRGFMERDDFTKRFKEGHPISMHELLYPLAQGYDSVMLECDVEMGGTDQRFNLAGGARTATRLRASRRRLSRPFRCSKAPTAWRRCRSPRATTSASRNRRR